MTLWVKNVSGAIDSLQLNNAQQVPDDGIVDLEADSGNGVPWNSRVEIIQNFDLITKIATGTWQVLDDDGATPLLGADAFDKLCAGSRLAVRRLSVRTFAISKPVSLVAGGSGHAKYYGPTGVIEEISGVVSDSIAMVSSATLTPSINVTEITDGALIFDTNYSAGDTVTATPSANNTIADGDMIHVARTGANMVEGDVTIYMKIRVAT